MILTKPMATLPIKEVDPNYPAMRYHSDGRTRLTVRNEREDNEQCAGWSRVPVMPAPPKEPVPYEKVTEMIEAAARNKVDVALADQKVKHDEAIKKLRAELSDLDQAFKRVETERDILKRKLAEAEKASPNLDADAGAEKPSAAPLFEGKKTKG